MQQKKIQKKCNDEKCPVCGSKNFTIKNCKRICICGYAWIRLKIKTM